MLALGWLHVFYWSEYRTSKCRNLRQASHTVSHLGKPKRTTAMPSTHCTSCYIALSSLNQSPLWFSALQGGILTSGLGSGWPEQRGLSRRSGWSRCVSSRPCSLGGPATTLTTPHTQLCVSVPDLEKAGFQGSRLPPAPGLNDSACPPRVRELQFERRQDLDSLPAAYGLYINSWYSWNIMM